MLAKKGANVVIVARSVGKLEDALKSISVEASHRLSALINSLK